MTEVRAQLAKALRLKDVPDPVWNNLMDRGLVRDYERDEITREDLVTEAKSQLKTYRQTRAEVSAHEQSAADTSKEIKPELGTYEKERAVALGEYVAFRASLDPHVRYFRKVVLGGDPLTSEQARAFVRSAANQCFGPPWFVEQRIPMRDHYSHAYSDGWEIDEEGAERRFDDIYIDPPGGSFRKVTYEPLDFGHRDVLRCRLSDGSVSYAEEIQVEIGSVLDVLRRVSGRLVENVGRAWAEEDAAGFVLTGEAVPVAALSGRTETFSGDELGRGTITLIAEPWVPAETVLRYYRDIQTDILGGQHNRQISKRSLALFRFITREKRRAVPEVGAPIHETPSDDGGVDLVPTEDELRAPELIGRPSWRALRDRWNRSCPDPGWRYDDVRNFRRAAVNAAGLLLRPTYGQLPGWPYHVDRSLP